MSAPHIHVRPPADHHNVRGTSDRTLYHSLITTWVARVDPRPPLQTPHGASLSPPLAAGTSYGPIDGHKDLSTTLGGSQAPVVHRIHCTLLAKVQCFGPIIPRFERRRGRAATDVAIK